MDFVATIECAHLFVAIWLLFVLVFAFCSEISCLYYLLYILCMMYMMTVIIDVYCCIHVYIYAKCVL